MNKKSKIGSILLLIVTCIYFVSCSNNSFYKASFPIEYNYVLEKYDLLINNLSSESFESDFNNGKFNFYINENDFEYKWSSMILDIKDDLSNSSNQSLGYILKDINNDSVDELFLVKSDHSVLAVFTIFHNDLKPLDAFWSKNKVFVLDENILYFFKSSGAQDFEYSLNKLNSRGYDLIEIFSFGCNNGVFYKKENNQTTIISFQEFELLLESNPLKNSLSWDEEKIIFVDKT